MQYNKHACYVVLFEYMIIVLVFFFGNLLALSGPIRDYRLDIVAR
jgi:hypothetical protein